MGFPFSASADHFLFVFVFKNTEAVSSFGVFDQVSVAVPLNLCEFSLSQGILHLVSYFNCISFSDHSSSLDIVVEILSVIMSLGFHPK